MRKNILLGMAVGAVFVLGSGGGAFAGEVNGHGDLTPGGDKARSACVYSGLQDGAEPGTTAGPGNVQNWGHQKKATGFITTESVRGAAEVLVTIHNDDGTTFTFTWGCNPQYAGG